MDSRLPVHCHRCGCFCLGADMATKIDTVERDGRFVHVYDNGMERDAATGRIIKPAPATVITPERATLLHRRRQEKQAALLRRRIAESHSASMPNPTNSAAAAFAESGAMLYEQVVLNSEAYPRDRLEAWEKLGKYAQVLPSDMRQSAQADGTAAALNAAAAGANAETTALLARVLRDVLTAQQAQPPADVVDGTAADGNGTPPALPPAADQPTR